MLFQYKPFHKGGNKMNSDHFNRWRNGSVHRCGLSENNKFIALIGGLGMSWTFKCDVGKITYFQTRKLSISGFRCSERWAKRIKLNELHFANATNRVEDEIWTLNIEPFIKCPADNAVSPCRIGKLAFSKAYFLGVRKHQLSGDAHFPQ